MAFYPERTSTTAGTKNDAGGTENDSGGEGLAALHRQYRDTHSRDVAAQLVAQYEALALSMTGRFSYRSDLDDLRQVALTALVSALNHFDPDRGVPFSTYAVPTITGALKRYFRDQAWQVKPPRSVQEAYLEVRHARDELTLELRRSPTAADLANRLNMPVDRVRDSMTAAGAMDHISLDAPARGTDSSVADRLLSDDHEDQNSSDSRLFVTDLLESLTEAEREVLVLTYFADIPQREIATRLGTNQVGVSRAKRRALRRLRTIHDASLARSA